MPLPGAEGLVAEDRNQHDDDDRGQRDERAGRPRAASTWRRHFFPCLSTSYALDAPDSRSTKVPCARCHRPEPQLRSGSWYVDAWIWLRISRISRPAGAPRRSAGCAMRWRRPTRRAGITRAAEEDQDMERAVVPPGCGQYWSRQAARREATAFMRSHGAGGWPPPTR